MSGKRHFRIVLGNREQLLNDMYAEAIRAAFPSIDFTFAIATTVPNFINLAADNRTDLAILMPPGNIDADPARPDSTPEEAAIHVIQEIKSRHPIPVICIAAHPVDGDAVLAAGADCFLDIPAQSAEITSAVATCLGL